MPEVGGDVDAWGAFLNANWSSLDTLVKSVSDAVDANALSIGGNATAISGILNDAAFTAGNESITGTWSFQATATFVNGVSTSTIAGSGLATLDSLEVTNGATFLSTVAFDPASIAGTAVAYATDTVQGVSRKATDAEVTAGVQNTAYVTPKQVEDKLAFSAGLQAIVSKATLTTNNTVVFTELDATKFNEYRFTFDNWASENSRGIVMDASVDGGVNWINLGTLDNGTGSASGIWHCGDLTLQLNPINGISSRWSYDVYTLRGGIPDANAGGGSMIVGTEVFNAVRFHDADLDNFRENGTVTMYGQSKV